MEDDISKTKMMPLRIHVGGLGETVAENEVSRIFESVGGAVEGIDVVRTKGRSFAYVDFRPSSNKSLSKLFGTVHVSLFCFFLFFFIFFPFTYLSILIFYYYPKAILS